MIRNSYFFGFILHLCLNLQVITLQSQLAAWNFENVTGAIPSIPILPSSIGEGISGGEGRLSGAQNNGSPTTCASPETWATNFWPTTSTRNTGYYMSFMVNASEGFRANITGINFMLSRSSSSAPSDFYVSVFRWGVETFISSGIVPITGCNNFSGTCNISGTSGGPMEIRIYLYRQNSAAMAATMRIDNVSISGTTEVETYSENKNHGFWIQQAFSDLIFKDLHFVLGNGESQTRKQYFWVDNVERRGLIYYRLKQIDFDGRIAFSKILPVSCENGSMLITMEDKTAITLFLGNQAGQFEEWSLFDLNGTRMQRGKIEVLTPLIKIPCPMMRTGYYILLISGKKGHTVKKINWVE
jgi:hypothetical protein